MGRHIHARCSNGNLEDQNSEILCSHGLPVVEEYALASDAQPAIHAVVG
jgi:hypothetical protein